MEAKDRSGPVPLSVTAQIQSSSPTSVHNMTSYFADDSQSTNSADFGFASSNSSRIWSSSGIASNTNAVNVNASANGTDANIANNVNVNMNMNANNVNINHNANLSSTRDRDKHGLTLNRSNSTTTTTGSGSPYYPSGLFSTFNSHSSNIDNNAHDTTVSNSGIGVSDVLDMNIRTMSGSVSIPVSPNENINSASTTQHSNSHSHSNSHTHSSSIDRFATGKFSSQSSASALTSLNLDNHHNLTPGSVSASLNNANVNVNVNANASLNSNHLSKSSFGPQGFMPGPLPGPVPSSGPSSSPPASSSASAPGPASSSNPSRGGHAQPQLQPRQVDHSSYEYMQHSLGPHSQIQPRQHQHQHQHHPDPLSNVMQGMHISGNPSHGHGHGPMHMSAMGMDPLEDVLGTFPCIRMRNLPYDANLQDVLILFQGLIILDVVVMPASSPYTSTQHNHQHNPTGEAFVLFANPMDFQMALQRSGLQMRHGGAQIEILQGKRGDYYAAISSVHARLMHGEDRRSDHPNQHQHQQHQHQHLQGGPGPGPGQGPLLSQSLWQGGPGHAHAGNMGIHQGQAAGVGVGLPSHGHPHGHALGHGTSNPHRDNNYKTNPSPPLGAGHGGSMPSTMKSHRGGRSEGRKGSGGRGSGRGGGIQVGEHTGYLRMRGLPFTSTKMEIFDFFKAYEPVEDSICLTYRSDGRATGEGYILFSTPDNAKEAMALHRNSMGSRYIELFISNKDEHGRAQAREPTLEE